MCLRVSVLARRCCPLRCASLVSAVVMDGWVWVGVTMGEDA